MPSSKLYELYLARSCGVSFIDQILDDAPSIRTHTDALHHTIAQCKLCQRSTRALAYIGTYAPNAKLVFVVDYAMGEGNKLLESKASHMLANIAKAVFELEEFSVLSLLKCGTHEATQEEITLCKPYLITQLQHMQARYIVLFGELVLGALLELDESYKGVVLDMYGKKAIATHAISALLRNASLKHEAMRHFHNLKHALKQE